MPLTRSSSAVGSAIHQELQVPVPHNSSTNNKKIRKPKDNNINKTKKMEADQVNVNPIATVVEEPPDPDPVVVYLAPESQAESETPAKMTCPVKQPKPTLARRVTRSRRVSLPMVIENTEPRRKRRIPKAKQPINLVEVPPGGSVYEEGLVWENKPPPPPMSTFRGILKDGQVVGRTTAPSTSSTEGASVSRITFDEQPTHVRFFHAQSRKQKGGSTAPTPGEHQEEEGGDLVNNQRKRFPNPVHLDPLNMSRPVDALHEEASLGFDTDGFLEPKMDALLRLVPEGDDGGIGGSGDQGVLHRDRGDGFLRPPRAMALLSKPIIINKEANRIPPTLIFPHPNPNSYDDVTVTRKRPVPLEPTLSIPTQSKTAIPEPIRDVTKKGPEGYGEEMSRIAFIWMNTCSPAFMTCLLSDEEIGNAIVKILIQRPNFEQKLSNMYKSKSEELVLNPGRSVSDFILTSEAAGKYPKIFKAHQRGHVDSPLNSLWGNILATLEETLAKAVEHAEKKGVDLNYQNPHLVSQLQVEFLNKLRDSYEKEKRAVEGGMNGREGGQRVTETNRGATTSSSAGATRVGNTHHPKEIGSSCTNQVEQVLRMIHDLNKTEFGEVMSQVLYRPKEREDGN